MVNKGEVCGDAPILSPERLLRIPTQARRCPRVRPPDGSGSSPRPHLECLYARYLSGFHRKSQQGPHEVPSIVAARAGIHVQKLESGISHYLQDVRVTAHEQPRVVPADFLYGPPIVIARIPADMSHVDGDPVAIPYKICWQIGSEFCAVNISVNTPDWLEGPESIENLDRPEVARMPNLVALRKMTEHGVIQKTVCVGEQPDSHSPAYPSSIFRQIRQAIIV